MCVEILRRVYNYTVINIGLGSGSAFRECNIRLKNFQILHMYCESGILH